MSAHVAQFPIERMASVLEVSRSGYYAWKRTLTIPTDARRLFDEKVQRVFHRQHRHCGRRRVAALLCQEGTRCSVNRVGRSMARQRLRARPPRRFRLTTQSRHAYPVAPNVLDRQFTVTAPNRVWVSDITYLRMGAGWLYLTVFLDLYSRSVVGWEVSPSLDHRSVLRAFDRAWHRRQPSAPLLLHTDRGIQYCCPGFQRHMQAHGVMQSMSRTGNCWDNAVAESFFATLKKEMNLSFTDSAHAVRVLFDYLEIRYNRQRPHSTLDNLSPVDFEQRFYENVA